MKIKAVWKRLQLCGSLSVLALGFAMIVCAQQAQAKPLQTRSPAQTLIGAPA